MFFKNQFDSVFNVLHHLLLKNFLFFIFNFESMSLEISSFNKYVLGINIVTNYSFISKSNLNQLKTNFWCTKTKQLVQKSKIKLVFFLDFFNIFFFVNFFKKIKITTFGLLPQTNETPNFDF